MDSKKITIVSDGNGAVTAAADLILKGHDVLLYNLKEKKDRMLVFNHELILADEETGKRSKVKIPWTTDPKKACEDARVIMYIMPGYAVETFAKKLAPYTDEDTIVFFNNAACFAPIIYEKVKGDKQKYIMETNNMSYATRFNRDTSEIALSLRVKEVFCSSIDKKYDKEILEVLREYLPQLKESDDLVHNMLLNANPETHCAGCILNAGRIDYSEGEFYLYHEGITENTLRVMRKVAKERRDIAKVLGYELKGEYESRFDTGYFVEHGIDFNTEDEKILFSFNNSPVFRDIIGPTSVRSRYFMEDLSLGLSKWEKMGQYLGVETKAITSLLNIGEVLEEQDLRELGESVVEFSKVKELIDKNKELNGSD